ncbi:MAG: shikimate kinase [Thioalkalivibrionaceae bacterium]
MAPNCQDTASSRPDDAAIVLVGPMGAGKSSIGRGLARALKRPFFDTDHEIERRTGVDIPTIFEFEGEQGFRDREAALLAEMIGRPGIVLATGGGVVMRAENRARLRDAMVVYLRVLPEESFRRTRKNKRRPLLNTADPKARLAELFALRDPLYAEVANVVIEGHFPRVRDAVRQVLRTLG